MSLETGAAAREPATDEAPAAPRALPLWTCAGIGVAAAVFGLLPWLVTGARLPLQNLWAFETLPEQMPFALLPFSQYAITLILSLLVVGAGVAGLAARALRPRLARAGTVTILAGALLVQIVATVQTTIAVQSGLRDGSESTWYLAALLAVVVVSLIAGIVAFVLIAAAPRAGALIGLSIAAVVAGAWLSSLLAPLGGPAWSPVWLLNALRFVPAVLIGAAIAWCGLRTGGRIAAAIAALVGLWIAPALLTAVSSAAGTRVYARHPEEMADYAVSVFRSALFQPELALPPLVVAVLVAAIGLLVRAAASRSAAGRTASRSASGGPGDRAR